VALRTSAHFDGRAESDPDPTRRQRRALRTGEEIRNLVGSDLLGIAGSEPCLHHRRRVDVDLDRRVPSTQDVALEIRRDVDHESVPTLVHLRDDVPLGNELRRLEQRRQERMRDPAREFGVIVDDGDRRVMELLRCPRGVREAIEARGATLRYLPKYSPDLNPIEVPFSQMKADLRKAGERTTG
jgi:DDE superfamily endonuclease